MKSVVLFDLVILWVFVGLFQLIPYPLYVLISAILFTTFLGIIGYTNWLDWLFPRVDNKKDGEE